MNTAPSFRAACLAALAVPVFLYLLAVLAFLQPAVNGTDFPLDDAWIHRVYARALSAGHGFAYNPGRQEAGSTSPLWAVVTAPAHGLEPSLGTPAVVAAVKLVGVLFGLAVVLAVQRLAGRLTGSRLAAGLAASLMALEPRLLFNALSGMEITLFTALWLWAAVALIERRNLAALVLLGLAPTARPEGALLLPLAAAGMIGFGLARGSWKAGLASGLIPLIPAGCWALFCLHANGHLLPTTFYVKAAPVSPGLREFETAWSILTLQGFGAQAVFLVGLIAFSAFVFNRLGVVSGYAALFLLVAPAVFTLGVAGSRSLSPAGYYWTRWLDPAALVLTAAFAIGYGLLAAALRGFPLPGLPSDKATRLALRGVCGLALAALVASALPWSRSFAERRDRLASDSRAIHRMNVQPGQWIAAHTPPHAVVGVNDAGAIRYFGNRVTLDLLGLNHAELAFGRISRQTLLARSDWLAIFPGWFDHDGQLDAILDRFEPRHSIRIPLKEYTVCPAESQTLVTIYQKKP